ncbi:MAG: VWA domain-containing protein [Clostridia bacterium]|nr:VWA domain-containing protein [Clostridia bacterium]
MILAIWLLRPGKGRKARLSLLLRVLMTALICLALSGVSVIGRTDQQAAFLLVDVSRSMEGTDTLTLARQALEGRTEGMNVGVIAFGKNAMVETALSKEPALLSLSADVNRDATDLKGALALARALLPSDQSGGLAVLSDGRLTRTPDATDVDVPVNVLMTEALSGMDAQVTKVEVLASLYQGQRFQVNVDVYASGAGEGTLTLYQDGRAVSTREVSLRRGENTFAFEDVAAQTGVVTYEARLRADGDSRPGNDRAGAVLRVSGTPRVLIAEGSASEGQELAKMLTAAGIDAKTANPAALPETAAEYQPYQAVALVNVDLDDVSDAQQAALVQAVRELGRGLAVFGGDSSYARGGYRGSLLEEALPVTSDVRSKLDIPTAALVIAIDKSGSMTDGQFGVTRLEVAKEAACRSVEVLNERDQIGVIAFDDTGAWVVPLAQLSDVAGVQAEIGTIRPGGGTAFYPPIAMAYEALRNAKAQYRHLIFLTDGEAGDRGYEGIVRNMAEAGITVTTVAVGTGADVATMKRLAELGKGRCYYAGEFDNVPKIFAKETMLMAGAYVQNRSFFPLVTDSELTGFSGFPALSGYLSTTAKPLATQTLISDREDPILCWWQFGAGRALAWTSDINGAWTENYLRWEEAAAFFGGLLYHIMPEEAQDGEISVQDGRLVLTLSAPVEGGQAEATVLTPDGKTETVRLDQTTPTKLTGAFPFEEAGAYAVTAIARDRDGRQWTAEGGTVIGWSEEYDLRSRDTGALLALSQATGGSVVQSPEELLRFAVSAAPVRTSLSALFAGVAGLLLLADIAQRRLDWEKRQEKQEKASRRRIVNKREKTPRSKPEQNVGQTSEALWQNLQKRKRM